MKSKNVLPENKEKMFLLPLFFVREKQDSLSFSKGDTGNRQQDLSICLQIRCACSAATSLINNSDDETTKEHISKAPKKQMHSRKRLYILPLFPLPAFDEIFVCIPKIYLR